jgi:hypothetical protein
MIWTEERRLRWAAVEGGKREDEYKEVGGWGSM